MTFIAGSTEQEGQSQAISGAQIADVRATSAGFRFVLRLRPGFGAPNTMLLDLRGLPAGDYAVSYAGRWSIAPLTPPMPSVTSDVATLAQLRPCALHVTLTNNGLQDMPHATVELWATPQQGAPTLAVTQTVSLPAQVTIRTTLNWAALDVGTWIVTPWLRLPSGEIHSFAPVQIRVLAAPRTPNAYFDLSTTPNMLWLLGGLCVLAGLAAWICWSYFNLRGNT